MAIVSKQTNQTVELFNIPDDQLKTFKVESVSTKQGPYDKDLMELYKMEYERCAQRYDDLYKAAWTNFSYIALIAGAILTFGSGSFMTELSIFVATLPLLFWWIATFEPLNRYGDQVQARAACIERLLNELVGIGIPDTIYPGEAVVFHRFDVREGIESLRELIGRVRKVNEGVIIVGEVGITSHLGDLLRKAKIPSRIET